MNPTLLVLLVASTTLAARETVEEAALSARQMLRSESILTLTSVFAEEVNPSLAGQPFGHTLSFESF